MLICLWDSLWACAYILEFNAFQSFVPTPSINYSHNHIWHFSSSLPNDMVCAILFELILPLFPDIIDTTSLFMLWCYILFEDWKKIEKLLGSQKALSRGILASTDIQILHWWYDFIGDTWDLIFGNMHYPASKIFNEFRRQKWVVSWFKTGIYFHDMKSYFVMAWVSSLK